MPCSNIKFENAEKLTVHGQYNWCLICKDREKVDHWGMAFQLLEAIQLVHQTQMGGYCLFSKCMKHTKKQTVKHQTYREKKKNRKKGPLGSVRYNSGLMLAVVNRSKWEPI